MLIKSKQTGFGLIEVLMVVIVMGIGLLGMAKLQLLNTQTITTSYLDTQVTINMEEMVQRLRSNKQAAIDGDYNMKLTGIADLHSPSEDDTQASRGKYAWIKYLSSTVPNTEAALQCKNTGLCVLAVHYTGTEGLKKQVLAVQL